MVPLGIFLEDTHLRSYPMLFAVNSGGRAWHHHRELPFRYCVTCFVPVADRVRDVVEIASGDFARDCSVEISASVRVRPHWLGARVGRLADSHKCGTPRVCRCSLPLSG
jgi:hypothetical protein